MDTDEIYSMYGTDRGEVAAALREAQGLIGVRWESLEVYTPSDALVHIEGIVAAYRSQLLRGERIGNVAGLDILMKLSNYLKSEVTHCIDSPTC